MNIIVTGAAGFIGMHVARILLERGDSVYGIDNLNEYYDVELKNARLKELSRYAGFTFIHADIAKSVQLKEIFTKIKPNAVINLAAQAGVRYSISNPTEYIQSNIVGFANILEECQRQQVQHLVYASSSSVYGANKKLPYAETDPVDHPISLYAATKKSNELMAHTYSNLYGLPTTGLRYFTVYGPWGRPDMAPWLFTSAITEGRTIRLFNKGNLRRDFTFVTDVAKATVKILDKVPTQEQPGECQTNSSAPYRIYNVGNNTPVEIGEFLGILEEALGKKALIALSPMQPGDVIATYADVEAIKRDIGYQPTTPLRSGLKKWVEWYKWYHNLEKR